ncbi:MAG: DNA-protecting protein DprA [Isosphaera sp.]|nr:DNA-protecting protein DprA [Isosphaera sp.]
MSDTPDWHDHLALALVPGLGPKLTAALLERFGSAAAARRATPAELAEVPHVGAKLAAGFAAALRAVDLGPELGRMERHGVRAVPLGFPGYPPPLARVPAPPPLLYFRGDWADADAHAVGVVGSRACSEYGLREAARLARGLAAAGFTVVSGLARGVDAAAHRAALDAGGRTVAVLAGGLSRVYPPEHADLAAQIAAGRGCLVTETPMDVPPQPGMFPARNRIISGLSRAVVVVEASARSGALITARHAAEQGREVFVLPGRADDPHSAGCLELLRKGARLVRSADDVIEDLKGLSTPDSPPRPTQAPVAEPARPAAAPDPTPRPTLTPDEQRVYDALAARRHADELVRELDLPPGELTRVLTQLELKKQVRQLPGRQFERR